MTQLIGVLLLCVVPLLLVWWLTRVFVPRITRVDIAKLLKEKEKIDPYLLENAKHGTLHCDEEFLRIRTEKDESFELRWTDIKEVHAFKRDLFTTDLICLAFQRISKEEYFEVHEEMSGYRDMQKWLAQQLPGFSDAWFKEVAFPAFETNHRVIWKRGIEPGHAPPPPHSEPSGA